jgi:hypothetical protein
VNTAHSCYLDFFDVTVSWTGLRIRNEGTCSFATNFLRYLPDWEIGALQVSFRRAISCVTLLRWGPMRAKFLYPNRFRGLVLDGGML